MVRNELPARSHESTGSTHVRQPVRTCVGCKERSPAADLLRVVVGRSNSESDSAESVVVPDPHHRLPGRGAWLHPDRKCFDNAERRRAFGRALRVSAPVDAAAVSAFLEGIEPEGLRSVGRAVPVEKNRQQH